MEIKHYLKNLIGKRVRRKLVAFYVDDWGSVRSRDKRAVDFLRNNGVDVDKNRFTLYDTMASEQDLSALFNVLNSVKDKNGKGVCFTAVTNPCNPNYDAIRANNFEKFVSEPFTDTLQKYGYKGAFDLWKQGITGELFHPIFHGTEHISRKQFMAGLRSGHRVDRLAFECECVGVPGSSNGVMRPYYIESARDNEELRENLKYGLDEFENIFGFRARQFRAGGDVISPELYPTLKENGIEYMDETLYINRYLGDGQYKRSFNYTGKVNSLGQKLVVRNCVFEPSVAPDFDSVGKCMAMISAAFACRKPAIISSHRANFVGGIDEQNREIGLAKLRKLLSEIVKRYPDVEFVNADQMADIIFKKL